MFKKPAKILVGKKLSHQVKFSHFLPTTFADCKISKMDSIRVHFKIIFEHEILQLLTTSYSFFTTSQTLVK